MGERSGVGNDTLKMRGLEAKEKGSIPACKVIASAP
jgi:hypothetical protein